MQKHIQYSLNFELYIAQRLFRKGNAVFTRPVINISVLSIALGIAVLILSISILRGFQREIRDKIIGFGSHIQISLYDSNESYETSPIMVDSALIKDIQQVKGVRHVQTFANKAGIIKSKQQIEGILFKGVDQNFDWSFFSSKMVAGVLPVFDTEKQSKEIIISKSIADALHFDIGDKLIVYFIVKNSDRPKPRPFIVSGIYETGLEEFDKRYVIGDIRQIRALNKQEWTAMHISGYEVLVNSFSTLANTTRAVDDVVPYNLKTQSIIDINPQLFGWLDLMDQNVVVILVITLLVALIHMTSILLILIIERTNLIGILKALGTTNASIKKIFLSNGLFILLKGLLWGNVFALGLAFLQKYTHLFKLNQEHYYVAYIPIEISLSHILAANLLVIVICLTVMILPAIVVGKISPVKAIRFN
ncbi:MAG: ABC transporter permease [Bacteroidales bacterium]|nr:ABC transporter permease [Bacteroidales bacterium]